MATPSSLMQIWLIARFELIRVFMTKRGLFSLLAFALVWLFILRYPIAMATYALEEGQYQTIASIILRFIGLEKINQWSVIELGIYWNTIVYMFACLIILICADQTVTDRTRGTARFLILRVSRFNFFIGRFIGNFLLISILIAATLASTIVFSILRESTELLQVLTLALTVWLNMTIIVMPIVAMMAFLSTLTSRPALSTLGAIVFILLSILFVYKVTDLIPQIEPIRYAIPGMHFGLFRQFTGEQLNTVLIVPLFQTFIFLGLGAFVISRRSL